jgi:hypothetical protein
VFVAVSAMLARAFNAEGAERAAITSLVQAEAHGDPGAAVALIEGCGRDPRCRRQMSASVARLKHPGAVSILELQPSTSFALTGSTGTARVAWRAGGSLPVVQCVRVRHSGNVVSGLHVRLLAITGRLPGNATCGGRF